MKKRIVEACVRCTPIQGQAPAGERKALFFPSHPIPDMIILPRQARDKQTWGKAALESRGALCAAPVRCTGDQDSRFVLSEEGR